MVVEYLNLQHGQVLLVWYLASRKTVDWGLMEQLEFEPIMMLVNGPLDVTSSHILNQVSMTAQTSTKFCCHCLRYAYGDLSVE